jgi:hypothetical protein
MSENIFVNFIRWFFSPRSKDDWRSWNLIFVTIPWIIGILFLLPQFLQKQAVGRRQQLTSGVVTAYEPSNHNQCRYTFQTQGKQYSGISSALSERVNIGEQVQVYFDPQNPVTNSLDDFSDSSKSDFSVMVFMTIGIGCIAFCILLARNSRRQRTL